MPEPQPRDLLLQVSLPEDNSVVNQSRVSVTGRTSPDATVSINEILPVIGPSGEFEASITLEEGPNLIEIIASDLAGDVRSRVMTVIRTGQDEGIFGRVVDIEAAAGVTAITLEDPATRTSYRVEAGENTAVMVPGKGTASPADIFVGDFLAVLAQRVNGGLEAMGILVKPDMPVLHAHVTGSPIGQADGQVSLMDARGNLVTADILVSEEPQSPVITAIVRQDPRSGSLSVVGMESADEQVTRLVFALQAAAQSGAMQNQENLGGRLTAAVNGYLTTMQGVIYLAAPPLLAMFASALEEFIQLGKGTLEGFGLGRPSLMLSGVVQDVDPAGGVVSVAPYEGVQMQVKVTSETMIREFGEDSTIENIQAGQRIEAAYDPETNEAMTLDVVFPALDDGLMADIMAQARTGEPEDAVAVEPGQASISGIVKSAVSKIRPDVRIPGSPDDGNVLVSALDGGTVALHITDNTIIEKDGVRLNIGAVRIGDLVRPASVYDTATRELVKLVVDTPELQGTVRGKHTTMGGQDRLTISTGQLYFLTLEVSASTGVTIRGSRGSFSDVEVRQQVTSGMYDPISLQASELGLGSAKTLRITGAITSVDAGNDTVTVTTASGQASTLLIPAKPGIVTRDGSPAGINDLEAGDNVVAAYHRGDMVVVNMVVSST
jgi:hypothetical protein